MAIANGSLPSEEDESQEQRREMVRKELLRLAKRSNAEVDEITWSREDLYDR